MPGASLANQSTGEAKRNFWWEQNGRFGVGGMCPAALLPSSAYDGGAGKSLFDDFSKFAARCFAMQFRL
jgi:hypothetical protein